VKRAALYLVPIERYSQWKTDGLLLGHPVQEINMIKQQYPNAFNDDLLVIWKVFRKYLFAQKQQQTSTILTQRQQCVNLVKNGITRDMYPHLSLAAEIFLCTPISAATVECDFSTMNRILTDLRNRLTTQHLEREYQ
jgi:hypothetical protein